MPARFASMLRRLALLIGGLLALGGGRSAQGIVFLDTGDPTLNIAAPTGDYAGSGWAYQGYFGSFLGTMIAPQYFITAAHTNVSPTQNFISSALFNGVADVTYHVDTTVNANGYWNIPGTDLRIYKIQETFSTYAQLYTGSDEVGQEMVMFGKGGPRGAEVTLNDELKGWYHTNSDGLTRWGVNVADGVISYGGAEYLRASFGTADAVMYEAMLTAGDSGGGVFILENGVWKLAGINYGTDGYFDTNRVVDNQEFAAALFDRGGFYQGNDTTGWSLEPLPDGTPGNLYVSRISASLFEIQSIIGVPEPAGVLLVMMGGLLGLRRRR